MKVIDIFKNSICPINLVSIQDMKYICVDVKEKVQKNYTKAGIGKMKTKTFFCNFFKCSLNFRAHALKSELTKDSISNFVMF